MDARVIDWRGFRTMSGRKGYEIFIPAGMGPRAYEGPVVAMALETQMGNGFSLIMDGKNVSGVFFKYDVQPFEICDFVLNLLTA